MHFVLEDLVVVRRDDIDRLLQIEGVDRHIADVGNLNAVEGGSPRRHVVGAKHAAFITDLTRSEACAGSVRRADIERNADEADIEPFGGRLRRQPHHRGGATEPRHLVAA
jgi:hypothetical protein